MLGLRILSSKPDISDFRKCDNNYDDKTKYGDELVQDAIASQQN